ncbi:hypothetical protein BDY21DRAFT_366969 [Lineolata rhizophorae]|uniref:Uncharacterized protein n=1 Tax=Lineolata rhizophorae TaxID=578093 RepID=A0A6A6NNR5_9PEZI|nr:hypothetical protein BDY21DRAFT_366969 [Lineolata rhizophorae]
MTTFLDSLQPMPGTAKMSDDAADQATLVSVGRSSPSTIRFAHDILARVNEWGAHQAIIQPLEEPVLVDPHRCHDGDVARYVDLITFCRARHWLQSVWLRRKRDSAADFEFVEGAPARVKVPRMHLSPGLVDYSRLFGDTPFKSPDLACVLVVQGASCNLESKVRFEMDRDLAGVAMLEEALNGYSVVFSAATLKSQLEGGLDGKVFKHVQSLEALKGCAGTDTIGLLC